MIINKHTGRTAAARTPSLLASGTINPQRHHYDAEGWIDVIPAEIPEGRVAVSSSIDKDTGIEAVETEPATAAQDRQTADDVSMYGGILIELAGLLAAFPGIEAGMGYQQISDLMTGHVAGLEGDALARASVSILRADNLFTGRLFPAGIVGERFWRAIAAL